MPPDYMHIYSRYSSSLSQAILPDWFDKLRRKHIYISELKVAAFSRQIDDLVVPIWPYQFFNALQSDRWSDPNTMLGLITASDRIGVS